MEGGAGGACLILHGGLLLIVFLYMVPGSIFLIRRKYGHDHIFINLSAFGVVIFAVIVKKIFKTPVVVATADVYWTSPFGISHSTIGWSLFSAMFCQLIIGLLRPKKESNKLRETWLLFHSSLGYATIILSVIALLTGCSAAMGRGYLLLILGVFVPIIFLLYICTYYLYFGESNWRNIASSVCCTRFEEGEEIEYFEMDPLKTVYHHSNYTL